jgi:two-component system cell cycle response regulator DivK
MTAPHQNDRTNHRILLIEDNEQNRYLVSFLLQSRGWEVISAPDGPTGLQQAKALNPALILLDIQLPGMDGYAVAQALRADPMLYAIPIIAVTSFALPNDREQCIAAGCSGYLEKPIDPHTFVAQVEQFLEPAA